MKQSAWLGKAICACTDRIYGVPGYPVSDLINETGAELVVNEKVALEYALGDSLLGRRACVIVKHVGMNVLADPLVHATFQGLRGGIIVIAGDDPVAYGTQTIQNSSIFGSVAYVPVLDLDRPDPVEEAFTASETWSRVAILRFVPEDLKIPRDINQNPGRIKQKGRLADPDLTMYGRAKRAFASVPDMKGAGLLPADLNPVIEGNFHEKRSERGYAKTFCPGCPFRYLFNLLQAGGNQVIPDTGCSLLSMISPYSFGLANYGLGSSPAVASKSTRIALTGDYALLHSGLLSLIDLHAKGQSLLCIILQNRCMGNTGGQPVPDIQDYIGFLKPVISAADDERLKELIIPDNSLKVVIVEGVCPEVNDV